MKCTDIKLQLERGPGSARPKSLAEHLRSCRDCRDYADELRVRRLLGSMPLREADDNFERRVLDAAFAAASPAQVASRPSRKLAPLAVAAALVVAVLVGLQWQTFRPLDDGQPLASQGMELQFEDLEPVQLVLNSNRTLENVTVTVDLPAHLALKGYADSRHLEWSTNLSAGGNKLVLPVQLRRELQEQFDGAEGEILVMLEHEGRRKQFRIPVQPALRSSANGEFIYTT
jgi:hypothetical protein